MSRDPEIPNPGIATSASSCRLHKTIIGVLKITGEGWERWCVGHGVRPQAEPELVRQVSKDLICS